MASREKVALWLGASRIGVLLVPGLIIAGVLLSMPSDTHAQARTAERIVDVPHSLLNQGNPPNGSIRHDISGTPGTSPCAGGGTGALAIKIAGVWQCPRLAPGTGTGDTSGATASSVGELVLFGDLSGKTLGRSNSLNGIPFLTSGVVSTLASTGTGNVARATSATLTSPTLLTPTIGSFNNAQHTHDTATGGGQLNASTVFSSGVIPPARIISGAIVNSRCLRVSNVGQIEVAAEDCGSGGGGGSPGGVSGNLVFNEAGALGGVSNSAFDSITGRLTLNQKANGNDTLYSQRFTDTSPTGSFIKLRNADGSTDLFLVSTDGSVFLSSFATWKNTAAPTVPASGNTVVWTDLTDKNLKAQDSSGNVSITLRPIACSGTDKISSISSAGVVTCTADQGGTGTGVITFNTLNTSDQNVATVDDPNIDITWASAVSTHTLTVAWVGALSKIRQHGATMYSDQSNTITTGAQSFAAATSLTVPTAAGAAPATGGSIAYDSTSNTLEYGENGTNRLVVNTAGSQTLDNKTLANTTTANLRDTLMTLQDNVDSTKTLNFELGAITSGTNRVLTIPDANSVAVVPASATANQVVSHIDSAGIQQKVQLAFSNLTGSMGPTQGGTGVTAVAQGDLLYGDAANSWARLGKSTSATRYLTNTGPSNNPQWDLVNVANGITGIVPADNGGTGTAFFQVSGPGTSVKTYTFPNISTTVLTTAAAVTVAQGGTGIASGTSGGIPYFNSSSTISSSSLLTANAIVLGGGAGVAPTVVGSLGTTTTVLHGNASGAPSFSQIVNADIATGTIDLTTKVTSILPGANGGTNNAFMQFSGPATSLKTFTLPNSSASILTDAALVTASQGGTSNAFFQVSGPATSVKTFTFPNASATVLTDNAAITIAQGGSGQTTQTAAFNALDPLTTKGDIIVHDGTNSVRQAVGTNGFALLADSTQTTGVRWGAISASAGGSTTQIQYNLAGSLTGLSTATTDGTIVTFAAGALKVGSVALVSAPTPALGKLYVQTDDGKLYFGINGSLWGEVFVDGLSFVNLASHVTGTLPLANGGTNQTSWTASRCVRVNAGGTALEAAAADCGSGAGSGTVTVVSSGSLTSTALVTGGGTTTLQTPSATATLDSSGNMSLPGSLTLTGSGAGYTELAEGTAPSAVANRVTVTAPTDVTASGWVLSLPTTAGTTGQFLQTNGSGVTTWASPSGSGTVTATGGSLTANAVVLGAGSTDTKVVAGIVTDGTSKLTLGVGGTSVGSVDFMNATSGTITLAPVTGALGTVTLTLPARTDTLVTLGGTETLAAKTLTTPTIASFTNATHTHADAAGGGQLTDAALSAAVGTAKGGTGFTDTTFSGNTHKLVTTTGTLTSGRCAEWDASGNLIQAAAACGSGGGGTINSGVTNVIPKYTASTTLDDSLLSDDATTLTYTGTGGVSAPLFTATGTGAGYLELAEGSAPTLVANRFQIFAPADVAVGGLSFILPAAGATGFLKTTNSSGAMTLSIDTTSYAPLTSPSFTTPALGVATATSINGLTITTSTGTLTIANGKTVTVNQSLTLAGTDSTTMTFPTTSATIARTDAAQTFTGTQTFGAVVGTTWNGNTWATGSGTLSIAAGKTATVSNTLIFAGTDSTTMTFPGTSGTVATADSTKVFTNTTIDVEATGNLITTLSVIDFPAAGCNNTTASSFWDLPTSTPAVAACVSGTNTQKAYLDFADTSGGFSAQTGFRLPADFTGTVDAKITWLTTATSGNVKWSLSTICVATDATETDDPAFNTASTSTTAVPGVASRLQTSSITSLTITGCAAGEFMHVKVFRDGNDAADTASATVRLVGVQLVLRRQQ